MQAYWPEKFFRGVALEAWRRAIPTEVTRAEADFLERVLRLPPAARLLDVPCGNGRHAIELARRGYALTGVDLSAEFIAEARASCPAARWLQADMRSLHFPAEFDGAYCFGNSFGFLSPAEAASFLASVARALPPGARFVLDTGMAAESILTTLANRWHRLGDIFMLSHARYHPSESRLDIDYTFIRGAEVDTRPTSSYVFTAGELCRMHASAGLRPLDLLASTNADPYQLGSPRLLLVSEKS